MPETAVLIPCYNEEITVGQVVKDFRKALPDAKIHVYDNASSDGTIAAAKKAGAIVRSESLRGKGNVVRRMFADINADYYILVDGDATYEAAAAPAMLKKAMDEGLDMVNGARVTNQKAAYRTGHVLGNKILTGLVTSVFGRRLSDMLSGYRVFSYRFVKSFPALAGGFETETELTVHALELGMPIGEVATEYFERPEGSVSKLRTYTDGLIILKTIINLCKQERPLLFFSTLSLCFAVFGLILGIPVVIAYFHSGLVTRLPSAILATGLEILAALFLMCALIMDGVALSRREHKHIRYISLPAPKWIRDV